MSDFSHADLDAPIFLPIYKYLSLPTPINESLYTSMFVLGQVKA